MVMWCVYHQFVFSEKNTAPISKNLNKVASLESHIIFEDDCLLVLNKPSGIAVHGGSGLNFGVIEALRALRPEARFFRIGSSLRQRYIGYLISGEETLCLTQFTRTNFVLKRYKKIISHSCVGNGNLM